MRREQLGMSEGVHFVDVGAALVGRGFDEIILDDVRAAPLGTEMYKRREGWITEFLPTKLYPRGQIKTLTVSHLD